MQGPAAVIPTKTTYFDALGRLVRVDMQEGTAGTINVFARNPRPESILYRIEIPRLLDNPNVFKPLQYK